MALTKCPDCEKETSDQAPKCPNCGRPLKKSRVAEAIAVVGAAVIPSILFDEPYWFLFYGAWGCLFLRRSRKKKTNILAWIGLAVVCLFATTTCSSMSDAKRHGRTFREEVKHNQEVDKAERNREALLWNLRHPDNTRPLEP
jgi:hypothetical protein